MINAFILEKRYKSAQRSQTLQRKAEQQEYKHNKYNEKLREIFDRRIERIIEHRKQTPLEPVQNFVLNETFFKELNNMQYKMGTTNGSIPFLKRSFNCSKKAQIAASIEKNKILMPEYTATKPVDFRPRKIGQEIQPGLRFKNEHEFRQTRCNTRGDNSSESRPSSKHSRLNKSLDTTAYSQQVKNDFNKVRQSHTRRVSMGNGLSQCTGEASSIAETVVQKTRTELDSVPYKSILTRTLHLPRTRIEFKKKRYDDVNISELQDEMLQGEDLSFEHIVLQSTPERMATLKNAKDILKAAKVIK